MRDDRLKPANHVDNEKDLYDPSFEHDSCGIGFLVNIKGNKNHKIIEDALVISEKMEHRGGCGCEENTGDGAGLLIQMPDKFFRGICDEGAFSLPNVDWYGAGLVFLSMSEKERAAQKQVVENIVKEEGQNVLGWRDIPVNDLLIGPSANNCRPYIEQIFIARSEHLTTTDSFERKLYIIRKRAEREESTFYQENIYFPSLSARTFVYKGMLLGAQLESVYPELLDDRMESALAMVHTRFSTNTFPSWPLAQPFRFVAHNGEINTLRGNRNWMKAREALCESKELEEDLKKVFPVVTEGASDSASFDEVVEFLHMTGRPLPLAILMMIPEAWSGHSSMSKERKAFYEYHSCLMEPWDGPASMSFTDGKVIGAILDRNGLRPSRYYVTKDDMVIMASEVGVLEIPAENIKFKERLRPGRIFLVDTDEGRIIDDEELKEKYIREEPYLDWLNEEVVNLSDLPGTEEPEGDDSLSKIVLQKLFGYTREDLNLLMRPMSENGIEATGSMGTDAALAVLSNRPRLLFDYFKQLFAQVTNPPLDGIREELVTQTSGLIGPENNLLDPSSKNCRRLRLPSLIINNSDCKKIKNLNHDDLRGKSISCLYPVEEREQGIRQALKNICAKADDAIANGYNFLTLSDKRADHSRAPIPSALYTAALHHHLVRNGNRAKTAIIVESGEPREVHHFAVLIGYGADAVNPYLALNSLESSDEDNNVNYIKAVNKGLIKIMSKMGISSIQSYRGAQIFEAIGLNSEFVDTYFTDTPTRLEGIGLDTVEAETRARFTRAFDNQGEQMLDSGGEYQWRRDGEYHLFNPDTVFKLQHSTQSGQFKIFKEYTELVDDQSKNRATLRGLFKIKTTAKPIDVEAVESIESIMKRFHTGAMSYGSISGEAHETLAIALNRIGGRSNTGEGGEDPERFSPDSNGDLRRSAIKQVASGRFGVTSEYLVNADDIQIKMAQGAKPGEGGQLPGHKVYPWVAKVRYSTPGVGLISPPPHHDIYSIEDLAQLIHDLKNANPEARVHVKLVSEVGVGTVAAGVAKAHSDVVLISGYDGGTGASPVTSLKHAGVPWELGLAETQQVLLRNKLRDRISVQVDGQLKTGRDCIIAALLGAEEFGFSTAPLVVMGCIMMRVCHLNTCPVGVATQDPVLRKKFNGKPEFVENFFKFIAEEIRIYLAEIGARSVQEIIGRADYLDYAPALNHWKAKGLDLSPILKVPNLEEHSLFKTREQNHSLDSSLDRTTLLPLCKESIESKARVKAEMKIENTNRTVGTILGSEVTKKYGRDGLPEDTIQIKFNGSAGQSFGAFLPRGISLSVEGDANDYVGKGLSGGKIVIYPPKNATFCPEENILVGNVVLYGATSGSAFFRGIAGERFAVRNSGAEAVVEGVGDHGCEYMTGGRIVILGETGRNFAAGMSGGIAYVYNPKDKFSALCNQDMVRLQSFQDKKEEEEIKNLIAKHYEFTESELAERMLTDWEVHKNLFTVVMPKDYKRVLEAIQRAKEEGLPEDEVVMEAAHG